MGRVYKNHKDRKEMNENIALYSSRKLSAEISYGSFDQLDLQLLNDYDLFYYVLQLQLLKFRGM